MCLCDRLLLTSITQVLLSYHEIDLLILANPGVFFFFLSSYGQEQAFGKSNHSATAQKQTINLLCEQRTLEYKEVTDLSGIHFCLLHNLLVLCFPLEQLSLISSTGVEKKHSWSGTKDHTSPENSHQSMNSHVALWHLLL